MPVGIPSPEREQRSRGVGIARILADDLPEERASDVHIVRVNVLDEHPGELALRIIEHLCGAWTALYNGLRFGVNHKNAVVGGRVKDCKPSFRAAQSLFVYFSFCNVLQRPNGLDGSSAAVVYELSKLMHVANLAIFTNNSVFDFKSHLQMQFGVFVVFRVMFPIVWMHRQYVVFHRRVAFCEGFRFEPHHARVLVRNFYLTVVDFVPHPVIDVGQAGRLVEKYLSIGGSSVSSPSFGRTGENLSAANPLARIEGGDSRQPRLECLVT